MFSFSRERLKASENKSEWETWSLWSNCFEKVGCLVFPWKPSGKLVVKKFRLSLTRKVKATSEKFIFTPQRVTLCSQCFEWIRAAVYPLCLDFSVLFMFREFKNLSKLGLMAVPREKWVLIVRHVYKVPAAEIILRKLFFFLVSMVFRRACGGSLNVFWLENDEKKLRTDSHGNLQWCISISEH